MSMFSPNNPINAIRNVYSFGASPQGSGVPVIGGSLRLIWPLKILFDWYQEKFVPGIRKLLVKCGWHRNADFRSDYEKAEAEARLDYSIHEIISIIVGLSCVYLVMFLLYSTGSAIASALTPAPTPVPPPHFPT